MEAAESEPSEDYWKFWAAATPGQRLLRRACGLQWETLRMDDEIRTPNTRHAERKNDDEVKLSNPSFDQCSMFSMSIAWGVCERCQHPAWDLQQITARMYAICTW